jgi:hypothetical protein
MATVSVANRYFFDRILFISIVYSGNAGGSGRGDGASGWSKT